MYNVYKVGPNSTPKDRMDAIITTLKTKPAFVGQPTWEVLVSYLRGHIGLALSDHPEIEPQLERLEAWLSLSNVKSADDFNKIKTLFLKNPSSKQATFLDLEQCPTIENYNNTISTITTSNIKALIANSLMATMNRDININDSNNNNQMNITPEISSDPDYDADSEGENNSSQNDAETYTNVYSMI